MMLVISVIVAVAILGILLGFLGNIGGFGAGAKTVIPDLVKKVANKGYGIESKDNVEFSAGDIIVQKEAIGEAPIDESKLKFVCASGAAVCESGGTAPLTIENDGKRITVNKKISASIAVCTSGSDYYVDVGNRGSGEDGIKKTAADAAEKCGFG
jgi:hypothetical protein